MLHHPIIIIFWSLLTSGMGDSFNVHIKDSIKVEFDITEKPTLFK
jgi:hypothetical protein